MPFIVWNDRLSVGIVEIDRDHKQLVRLLNALYDAIHDGRSREELGGILARLTDYAGYHFEREEVLFLDTEYPDKNFHIEEHTRTAAWISDLRSRFAGGSARGPSLEAVNYLKDWLFDHILGTDKEFVPYVAARLTASGLE
jgi:hemerythrin